MIVAFRRHTLLPLDDCLYALQPTIPNLYASSLHPLPAAAVENVPATCQRLTATSREDKFKSYPIGLLPHRYRRGADRRGKALYLFAIDRTSKFAYVEAAQASPPR